MQAIETQYGGNRFRSRLEARWAVFFDSLGIVHVYEPEGFKLPGGLRYLPDFWLPNLRCWIEVKGSEHLDDDSGCKALGLARESGNSVYVFCGPINEPGDTWAWHFGYRLEIIDWQSLPFSVPKAWWFCCPLCETWQLGPNIDELPCRCIPRPPDHDQRLVDALTRARQARFEFGETPQLTASL